MHISASRAVFARIEAAEIGRCRASPSTMARARKASRGQCRPSIHTSSGGTRNASTARCMASSEAWWMLSRSISSTLAKATAQAIARCLILPARISRRSGGSTLESASPRTWRAGSRITAAAYTGPASGPRPASSTPQTTTLRIFPVEDIQDRVGGFLDGVPPQQLVELGEALALAALRARIAQQREQRGGERSRRGVVLQQLGYQLLAGEDVGHADVWQVQHRAHQRSEE